jgi:hypothetical protein
MGIGMKGENTMNPQQTQILRDIVQRMMARYMTIRPLGIDLGNGRKLIAALNCRILNYAAGPKTLHGPGALGAVVRKLPLQAADRLHFRQKLSALHRQTRATKT